MRTTIYAVRHAVEGVAHVETGPHGLSRYRARKLARRLGGVVVRVHIDP